MKKETKNILLLILALLITAYGVYVFKSCKKLIEASDETSISLDMPTEYSRLITGDSLSKINVSKTFLNKYRAPFTLFNYKRYSVILTTLRKNERARLDEFISINTGKDLNTAEQAYTVFTDIPHELRYRAGVLNANAEKIILNIIDGTVTKLTGNDSVISVLINSEAVSLKCEGEDKEDIYITRNTAGEKDNILLCFFSRNGFLYFAFVDSDVILPDDEIEIRKLFKL